MKDRAVIIGASGHWEYAVSSESAQPFLQPQAYLGFAPGSEDEDISRLYDGLLKAAGVPYFQDWRRMLDSLKPDLAVVNPHYHLHAEIALECLKRGIGCFVEKPVALNPGDLEALEAALADQPQLLGSMMHYRYDPVFRAVLDSVARGEIGQVLQIFAQKSYKMGTKAPWMQDQRRFGGIIPWVGSHVIDLLQLIVGSRLRSVIARSTKEGNQGNGDIESAASCLFTLDNGGQALISLDYLRTEGAKSHGDDRLRIAGEEGILEVIRGKASLLSASGYRELHPAHGPGCFEDFLIQLKGEGISRNPAPDILRSTALCLAAMESAETGKEVLL